VRPGEARHTVEEVLDAHGIPYVPGSAAFFVLVDLGSWPEEPTWEAEHALWRRLLDANVNLTPGSAIRAAEPGVFRLCFASVPGDVLRVGLERIVATLG